MKVDPLAQVSDVLGSFVGDSGHVVLINEHGGGRVGGEFLHIDDRAVGDAADFGEPGAALALEFVRSLRLASKQSVAHCGQGERGQG